MPVIIFFLVAFLFVYLEFSLLFWLGEQISIFGLLVVLLMSSLLGLFMIRARGWYTLLNVQKQLSQGEIPTQSLLKSGIWIVAGVLFFIPGLLTDILAILLLLPSVDRFIFNLIKAKLSFFSSKILRKTDRTFRSYRAEGNTVYEAEYEKQTDEDKRIK